MRKRRASEEAAAATLRFYEEHRAEISDAYGVYELPGTAQFAASVRESGPEELLPMLEAADMLLVTATELESRTLLGWLHKHAGDIGSEGFVRVYDSLLVYTFFRWHGHAVTYVSLSHTGSDIAGGSSDVMREVIEVHVPRLVATLGIAFGRDWNVQRIGDVLVARRWVAHDRGIKLHEGETLPKDLPSFSIAPWLDNRLRAQTAFFADGHTHYGTMLTGEAVVDDDARKRVAMRIVQDFVHDAEPPIGGEMEAFGICRECERANVPVLMMKGICDWAAGKNNLGDGDPRRNEFVKDHIQVYAMTRAIKKFDELMQSPYLLRSGGRDEAGSAASVADMGGPAVAIPEPASGNAAGAVFNSYGDGAIQAGSIGSITVNR